MQISGDVASQANERANSKSLIQEYRGAFKEIKGIASESKLGRIVGREDRGRARSCKAS